MRGTQGRPQVPAPAAVGVPQLPAGAAADTRRGRAQLQPALDADADTEYTRAMLARRGDGKYRPTPDRTFTREEVAKHCVDGDCWIILSVRKKGMERRGPGPADVPTVFDVSDFVDLHPGGARSVLNYAGKDASSFFYRVHSNNAFQLPWHTPLIKPLGTVAGESTAGGEPVAPEAPMKAKLARKDELTHDTKLLVVALPGDQGRQLQPGGHFSLSVGQSATRNYTPVLTDKGGREVHIVVKRYPGGAVSPLLHDLPVGGELDVLGPVPCPFEFDHIKHETVVLLAGGTGAAPILSIASAVVDESRRAVCVVSDKTPQDALFREEFAELLSEDPDNMSLQRVFTRATAGADGVGQGDVCGRRLDEQAFLREVLPKPQRGTAVVICGPRNFNRHVGGAVRGLGYNSVTVLGDS